MLILPYITYLLIFNIVSFFVLASPSQKKIPKKKEHYKKASKPKTINIQKPASDQNSQIESSIHKSVGTETSLLVHDNNKSLNQTETTPNVFVLKSILRKSKAVSFKLNVSFADGVKNSAEDEADKVTQPSKVEKLSIYLKHLIGCIMSMLLGFGCILMILILYLQQKDTEKVTFGINLAIVFIQDLTITPIISTTLVIIAILIFGKEQGKCKFIRKKARNFVGEEKLIIWVSIIDFFKLKELSTKYYENTYKFVSDQQQKVVNPIFPDYFDTDYIKSEKEIIHLDSSLFSFSTRNDISV